MEEHTPKIVFLEYSVAIKPLRVFHIPTIFKLQKIEEQNIHDLPEYSAYMLL